MTMIGKLKTLLRSEVSTIVFDDLTLDIYRLRHSQWLLGGDAQDAPDDYSDPVLPDYVAAGVGQADLDDYYDAFRDGVIDSRWSLLRVAGGSVAEITTPAAGLECDCGSSGDIAGLVSAGRYNLSDANLLMRNRDDGPRPTLVIALTQTFGSSPKAEADCYSMQKNRADDSWVIGKRVGGTWTELATGTTSEGSTSILQIDVTDGTVSFTVSATVRYSESWDLDSYDCYVYLYCEGFADSTGTCRVIALQASCTYSLKGMVALNSEMARVQVSTKQVRGDGTEVRYGSQFPRGTASGAWIEIGLFSAAEVARIVSRCNSETGWSYGANDGSLELTDHREGSAALEAEGTDETPRFLNATLRGPTGDEDRFTDGSIGAYWSQIEVGTGTVTEQNGRLECACPAHEDCAGVVTANTHDVTTSEICITVDLNTCLSRRLLVSLDKYTAGDPASGNNWYLIEKRKSDSHTLVHRKVGGALTTPYDAAWTAATGELRIRISGGNIYFYEDDIQRWTEAYGLSSYNCYVHLYCRGETDHLGTDRIDDYVTSLNPVTTTEAWLQFFYYVDDTDSPDGDLRIRVGNDASNYWQFTRVHDSVAEGWQWLSLRISDYESKVGSPAFNQLIDYFVLDYDTALLASLLDRIDFIRLFVENGDLWCRGEFLVGSPKGLNEARHVIWRLRVLGN